MEKRAYHSGNINALRLMGQTPEQIKLAYVRQGYSAADVDSLIKEAFGGVAAIGRGIVSAGRGLLRAGAGRTMAGANRIIKPGARGMLGNMASKANTAMGSLGQSAGAGLMRGGQAFAANPMQALGQGAVNAGKGALFFGGKGIGGTIGKGVFLGGMANMLRPSTPGPRMPQPYGQYPQQ